MTAALNFLKEIKSKRCSLKKFALKIKLAAYNLLQPLFSVVQSIVVGFVTAADIESCK